MEMARKRAAELGGNITYQLFSGLKKEGIQELQDVLTGWLGCRKDLKDIFSVNLEAGVGPLSF